MFKTVLVLAAFVAAAFAQAKFDNFDNFEVVRWPMTDDQAAAQSEHPDCTAIYKVTLRPEFTTQGNDLGMLPTHGKDTTLSKDDPRYDNFKRDPSFRNVNNIGGNYVDQPKRNDQAAQAAARARNSVTALTEDRQAYPMGFKRDTLRMHHAICVEVHNVGGRWVEIMAESVESNQQICVTDWLKENVPANPHEEGCGMGELYDCRDSDNPIRGNGQFEDKMSLKFYCRDNCDAAEFELFWRVTASQLKPRSDGSQPDGEDWCMWRDGDDFPSSLVKPYPIEYVPPPVFDRIDDAASVSTVSAALLAIAAVLAMFW